MRQVELSLGIPMSFASIDSSYSDLTDKSRLRARETTPSSASMLNV